jgi:murein DD-endopeptidase MepM/ murein hydrolase activator NlpD
MLFKPALTMLGQEWKLVWPRSFMSHHPRASRQNFRHRPVHQVIIARGDEVHTFILHRWMIVVGGLSVLAATFWLFAATAYVMFRDDVLASMIARQTRQQHAYEDRIAALRLQVDRVTSRQLLDQDAFTARLDELLDRQKEIEKRSLQVSELVGKARDLGVRLGDDALVTGSIRRTAKIEKSGRVDKTLDRVENDIGRIGRYQETTLGALEGQMQQSEKNMRGAVADLGLSLDSLVNKPKAARPMGQGGPFIPLRMGNIENFRVRANYVANEMAWLRDLKQSLNILPVRNPLQTNSEITSGFGGRVDPFEGRGAFHAGLDFRGDKGDPVRATAEGVISKAGRVGGYGNLVEVTHKNGFITRYGHLSAISVTLGQKVKAGQIVGKLGSTGRSTGPHLHYETRISGNAVNPQRFMRAGKKLSMW